MKKQKPSTPPSLNRVQNLLENLMQVWLLLYVSGLLLGMGAYLLHMPLLNYLSFMFIVLALGMAWFDMYKDMAKDFVTSWYIYLILLVFVWLYVYFRWAIPDFSFTVSDASDYYLSGINSVLNHNDIGFFLPLTASVSATGVVLFGYGKLLYFFVLAYMIMLPLVYFVAKELKFSTVVSLGLVALIVVSPMSIWFSKTSFTESLWQVLLLSIVLQTLMLMKAPKISMKNYIVLALLVSALAFSRGEAVLISGLVFFLSLYHFWRYANLKMALIILSSLVFLFLTIQYAVSIRSHYMLTWQFSRVIPHITAEVLTWVMYSFLVAMMAVLSVLYLFKKRFSSFSLPLFIVSASLVFKVIIALVYVEKKHIPFMDLWFLNEYSFAVENFGLPLLLLAVGGLILVHIKAVQNHALLVLVVSYALFSLPFIMQTTNYATNHEFFLYWSRYYYSYLMLVYIFSIGVGVQYLYEQSALLFQNIYYRRVAVALLVVLLFLGGFKPNLHQIVTSDSYLHNSTKLIDWIVKKVPNSSVSIVFPTDLQYGNSDIKQLIRRDLKIHNIHVNHYYKVYAKALEKTLKLADRVYTSKYIICFSNKKCLIDKNRFMLKEQYNVNIPWRKHEAILSDTKIKNLDMNVYLYEKR